MIENEAFLASKQYYDLVNTLTSSTFENAKVLGKFYTNLSVAERMVEYILSAIRPSDFDTDIRIIDPFCGDGRLVCLLIKRMIQRPEWANFKFQITLWDIEKDTVDAARVSIENSLNNQCDYSIVTFFGDAFVNYKCHVGEYDICITNPPWGLIKPLKIVKGRHSPEEIDKYKTALSIYDEYMKAEFARSQPTKKFGTWGTNLGRCGVELSMRLIKDSGVCAIVSPASIFNDQVSFPLREWIFENYSIESITYYPAELKLFGSADISSIYFVAKKERCYSPVIRITIYDRNGDCYEKDLCSEEMAYIRRNKYIIPFQAGFDAVKVLASFESLVTVQEYCEEAGLFFTRELDETRVADKLCRNGTIRFAKGYMVNRFDYNDDGLFLNEEKYHPPLSASKWKLVWRDVSRNSQKRRMKATILPPGYICGNSLGVIYAENEEGLDKLKVLLAIMNSAVFEFQARSLLVTNHVSAGVIKQIKIPEIANTTEVVALVEGQLKDHNNEWKLEAAIAGSYGLSADELLALVQCFEFDEAEIQELVFAIKSKDEANRMIYNHYAAKLSELDMQIVKSVPPGGNWKDIPETIPSQRLVQIRESYREGKGSRSTYYGRLLPQFPSYTINTYFNRPGNGCHMHYEQDRTLSQREAARLQTFPDAFEFKGSLGAVNNQIGNAVPVLLAYQLAREIPFKGQFVDLFCGAGGLALGFIMAGWKPIIANDIDAYAIETHKANIDGKAICGDINSEAVFSEIVETVRAAKVENPDLPLYVLGGPPCQGFSTANTRRGAEDMRNWLFKSYARIVRAIAPSGFVFENVKGITNLDGGKFFEMIKEELKECIPSIKICRVNAAEYAIPQRRERVIIVGGSTDFVREFQLNPCTAIKQTNQMGLLPLPPVIGVKDALGDLPELNHAEDGSHKQYRFEPQNAFQQFMRGYISAEQYLNSYK